MRNNAFARTERSRWKDARDIMKPREGPNFGARKAWKTCGIRQQEICYGVGQEVHAPLWRLGKAQGYGIAAPLSSAVANLAVFLQREV